MCLENLINSINKKFVVQLLTESSSGDIYGISLPIFSLLKDWYIQCCFCPENEACVWNVVFYYNGMSFPLIDEDSDRITFEQLMEVLEKLPD
jgi:hypothetical protein